MSDREPPELLLAARRCDQCLTTRGRVVSGERAAEIIAGCRAEATHFQCHKGSIAGVNLHCRGVHDLLLRLEGGSQAWRFGTRIGVTVREVDPEELIA